MHFKRAEKLRILYVGSLAKGATSLHRYQLLKKLAAVDAIDTYMDHSGDNNDRILAYKVFHKIKISLDMFRYKKENQG